jgi:hypothetical protein
MLAGDMTIGWTHSIRRLKCSVNRIVVGGFQGQVLFVTPFVIVITIIMMIL